MLHEIRLAYIVIDKAVKSIAFNLKPGISVYLKTLLVLNFAHLKNSNLWQSFSLVFHLMIKGSWNSGNTLVLFSWHYSSVWIQQTVVYKLDKPLRKKIQFYLLCWALLQLLKWLKLYMALKTSLNQEFSSLKSQHQIRQH